MEKRELSQSETDGGFRKRTLSVHSLLVGSSWFVRNLPRLVEATYANRVDDRLREKILLTVSAANECRYCARVHGSVASVVGIDDETIDRILDSNVEAAVSEAEQPALLFALHYAETDGDPAPNVREAMEAAYDPATAADIVAFTRAMHVANLLGNTVDAGVSAVERRIDRALRHARTRCPI
ncbi:carboxymuconolactone decarboxylase family protein [Haloarculaceae archaeon H-GB2-1]|nr:carboxymuconolactone decarboxylase family protein [Haloarculaceae archaeon H-GB1-1]MEA5386395.1 carboxymuconolactone decarboxylase family protein [Haloarculaceae archaeon H-GB11]MEA5407905.1 carboxymuconolactone decarboxylase family protein [Haloarculaceae archaeon H-GB2-1]